MKLLLLLGAGLSCSLTAAFSQIPAQPADPRTALPAQPVALPALPSTNAVPATNSVLPAPQLVIAIDSSLKPVLPEMAQAWADTQEVPPRVILELRNAGSLRAEVTKGALWDVVISSDIQDVEDLVKAGLISKSSQRSLARNNLVVYGRHPLIKDDDLEWFDLVGSEWKKVVLGDPLQVGSGRVAQHALQRHGLWGDDKKSLYRLVSAETVALQWIQTPGIDAAIVYKTDLQNQTFPGFDIFPISAEDAPPIFYSAGVVANSKNADTAKRFIDFCAGDAGRQIWMKHGFETN